MINLVKISGLKSIVNESLGFNELTVFAGLNNSGKSSVIQAIRMALASGDSPVPFIEGLGGYSEIKSNYVAPDEPIDIGIFSKKYGCTALSISRSGYSYKERVFQPLVQFISAERLGPRVMLPVWPEGRDLVDIGEYGQFSAHFASIFEGVIVNEKLAHKNSAAKTLKHQLGWWLSEISPGVKLDFEVLRRYESSQFTVDGYRPTNSGYGISYVLPILLAILAASGSRGVDDSVAQANKWFDKIETSGSLLIIENPEAHLHPKGQTCLGSLIATAAGCGLQIIVETHSDHLIDGIRLAVKRGMAPKDVVGIYYAQKRQDLTSMFEKIEVDNFGKLSHWPKGFFDQHARNLQVLLERTKND